jgi:hypothetical protein
MGRLARVGVLPFLPLLLLPGLAAAQSLAIDHKHVGCMVAERFPVISARLDPAANVGRARVYFRAGGPHWYFVEMKVQGDEYLAALPKPKKSTAKIEYYIEALDTAFAASRTAEYAPDVVPPPGACGKDAPMAVSLTSAKPVVGAPAGAPTVPVGFSASGVATAGAAGATAGAAGAGTGVSVGVVAGVVGGAAAIAAVAVAAGRGGGTTATTQAPSTMAPSPTPVTTMPPPPPRGPDGPMGRHVSRRTHPDSRKMHWATGRHVCDPHSVWEQPQRNRQRSRESRCPRSDLRPSGLPGHRPADGDGGPRHHLVHDHF